MAQSLSQINYSVTRSFRGDALELSDSEKPSSVSQRSMHKIFSVTWTKRRPSLEILIPPEINKRRATEAIAEDKLRDMDPSWSFNVLCLQKLINFISYQSTVAHF
ncbi:hypothetical protein HAX54_004331 [Datura stramonium]|uniref:Uncharacterized protein n=1 Tax=Datura stramonium TaxID=4076 RepID=A0ABS8RHM4_DATST|nr:hypothetical protein [Datura stramonium]